MPYESSQLVPLDSLPEGTFLRVLQGAPDALVIIDAAGIVRYVNTQTERMFGYPSDELVGQPIERLVPARLRASHVLHRERYQSCVAVRPMGSGIELFGRRKDGTEFPVEVSLSPIETEQGVFISSAIRDISARKQAELATKLLAAIVDSSEDAILSITPDGVITSWNHGAERVFGYPPREAIGQSLYILGTDEHGPGPALALALERIRGGAQVERCECAGRHRDGRAIHLSATMSPIRDPRGVLVGVSAIARDSTEKRRVEASARLATERLISAMESIQGMFALFDSEDRLVLCNSEFRRFFASSAGTIVGQAFVTLVENSVAAGVFALGSETKAAFMARWMSCHAHPVGTLELRTNDGQTLRVAERPTAEGGVVTTIWDITEDVAREAELRQAREGAEAASAAKSEFLASMSHELRTPLNSVLGFAQLLTRDKKTPLSERQTERVEHIVKAGEHLLRLIDDVLDLSRIEAGRMAMSVEAVSVTEVLHEVERSLEPMAARLGVRIALDPLPRGPTSVRADRTRLAQVLLNYGSNAIKYGGSGGKVWFSVSQLDTGMLRMSVRDAGTGIALDKQDTLFLPFQRAGQELGAIEGTGIGLAICKRVSELMGGRVGFHSVPGSGAEFWVDLPVVEAVAAVDPHESALHGRPAFLDSPRRHTVLYVEDNPSNIAFMTDLMREFESIDLLVAPTAELGLDTARARLPEVIIMDINLPGMNGIDAAQQLKLWPETRGIPIVALSAAAMKSDRQKAQATVFHRYLTKPVRVDELMETLDPLLHS